MKTTFVVLCLFFMTIPAGAQNKDTAQQMINILKFEKVQSLLEQEDAYGELDSIEFLFLNKAIFGPATYRLNFKAISPTTPKYCQVIANVDIRDNSVMYVSDPKCINVP